VPSYEELLEELIDEQRRNPVDMLGIGDAAGELRYLQNHKGSFLRTLRDVDGFFAPARGKRILELGAFLGAVSIPLARLGHRVDALDIPEYQGALRALYARHGIDLVGANLRDYRLPYPDGAFDAVIACEILEHLNFNPLPVLQELNRITKPGGFLYVGMPNLASIYNRVTLALGRSIHPPVADYFAQLDRRDNMVVGLHWREYTVRESREMLERMGYDIVRAYYFAESRGASPAAWLRNLVYALVPPLMPYQVIIGRKARDVSYDFWHTAANR